MSELCIATEFNNYLEKVLRGEISMSKGTSTFPQLKGDSAVDCWEVRRRAPPYRMLLWCYVKCQTFQAPSYKHNIYPHIPTNPYKSLVIQHVMECFSFPKASNSLALKPSDAETAAAENLWCPAGARLCPRTAFIALATSLSIDCDKIIKS